jgi:uncharacterized protein
MAGSSFFALIDDIASLLDDVAVMTKVAAKKTTGLLGDDLALNAEQVTGVDPDRELPVVWAVFIGSLKNKFILVPAALMISAFIPWLLNPLLMIGGIYLCFEGAEKIVHHFTHSKVQGKEDHKKLVEVIQDSSINILEFENKKIKGAIRTDFILSAEIIVIALGTVVEAQFIHRLSVVSLIALLMTVGVYGLVAVIVKLDDAGFYLVKNTTQTISGNLKRSLGRGILLFAPFLMKTLSRVGTLAMFIVGGGILGHGISFFHHIIETSTEAVKLTPYIGSIAASLTPSILNALLGLILGVLAFFIVDSIIKLKKKMAKKT